MCEWHAETGRINFTIDFINNLMKRRKSMKYDKLDLKFEENVTYNAADVCPPIRPRRLGVRSEGNFKGRAYFLPSSSDWIIGKDDLGCTILVEVRGK